MIILSYGRYEMVARPCINRTGMAMTCLVGARWTQASHGRQLPGQKLTRSCKTENKPQFITLWRPVVGGPEGILEGDFDERQVRSGILGPIGPTQYEKSF